ncbi:MAG: hypothetical protein ACW98I_01090 [Candidatus Hodarchaeales archaeon]
MQNSTNIIKQTNEDPIAILIMEKSGLTIFSYEFKKEHLLEDQMISGFLTALNAFGTAMFSESGIVDQITFKEYTFLMREVHTYLFCYIFKGTAFCSSLRRLEIFIYNVTNIGSIWNELNQATDLKVKICESMLMHELLKEIFM